MTWRRAAVVAVLGCLAITPNAGATPLDNREAAIAGADRLLIIQNADGSFPWLLPDTTAYANVQGVTAIGLTDAYKLSLDPAYAAAAKKNRDWTVAFRDSTVPKQRLSAPSVYFLAEYALLTGNLADFDVARAILTDTISFRGGGAATVNFIVNARATQGNGNLGLWDGSLLVRAAQDVGMTALADEMAQALAAQTTVDEFDSSATYYELGLTGLLLALSEENLVGHASTLAAAATALKAAQAPNGSFPLTYAGVPYPDDTQSTAYAVMGLLAVGELESALKGADFVVSTQRTDGSFAPYLPDDASEYGEVDAEAVSALVAATLVVPNGAVAYLDRAKKAI